jgi:hypothetical protein
MAKKPKKEDKKLKKSRGEGWMRIPVGIVSGIIIYVWAYLIGLFFIINFLYKVISGKVLKDLVEMSNIWSIQNYNFIQYMIFNTEDKPFPFTELKKEIGKNK